ncbi:MAG: PadR family transcriptional regulator [Hyphomicrobiaceae bacterium]|nr:PadR family transcriptional regulator [Hyphomicrobiaceae bacterium]
MALAEAILVCLTERPMTGYELAKAFDSSIGFFWRAAHQQIYRELQGLRGEGLVDSEEVIQSGRPNKTIYTVNAQGLRHLREWSRQGSERPPTRDNLFVKLYALDCVDLAAVRAEIAERLVRHKARLALYERIEAKRFSGRIKDLRRTGLKLGLQMGLTAERGHIAWCQTALATLDQHLEKPARRDRSLKAPA